MRPRYVALIVVLIAVPVGIALLVGRAHEGVDTTVVSATQVSLELKGGSGDAALAGCGTTHHYTEYRGRGTIRFAGAVVNPPRGGWKVKVKLKACIGGRFESAGDLKVHRRHGGRYRGSVPTPVSGLYFARAQVSAGHARLARSDKQFFRVR
jgi:hypothetical protein